MTDEKWQDGTLEIHVIDNGIGISNEEHTTIFDESSRKGLWLSKQIVNLMGGDLSFTSKGKGWGSTFTLSLPTKACN
jgi:signal transduction histidine kinase